MIDLKDLRQNPDQYRTGAANKNHDPAIIDQLLDIDQQLRDVTQKFQALTAEQNRIGKEIGQVAGQMKKANAENKAALQDRMKQLQARPNEIKGEKETLSNTLAELEPRRDALWLQIPQPADRDVPIGKDSSNNTQLRTWNPQWFDPDKSFSENKGFDPKNHIELMQAHQMVDFERGVKLSGSRSYVLTGAGMALHQAILRFAFDFMTHENGFIPVSAPPLVREYVLVGTGFFPHGKEDVYHIANPTSEDELYLTGTGEAGLMALHADEIVDADQLPLCYTTVSTCFRREAGSAGKDTAGLFRIHQFDKVEQVVICKADEQESRVWHSKMIGFVETLLQRLELPYRLLQCCTGDLGVKNADMIDLECWMPSRGEPDAGGQPRGAYSETHSASRLYDYQCRRLNLRYRDPESKKTAVCHSLNNTVAASPRILIPIIEMYQNADGSITIPEVLRPHMGGKETIG